MVAGAQIEIVVPATFRERLGAFNASEETHQPLISHIHIANKLRYSYTVR